MNVITVPEANLTPNPKTAQANKPSQRVKQAPELEALWAQLLSRTWSSLLVVPVQKHVDVAGLARSFEAISPAFGSAPLVIDVRGHGLDQLLSIRGQLDAARVANTRVLLVGDVLENNALSQILAKASDATVLIVELGKTDVSAAERAASLCPKEKLLGAVTVKPD